MAGRSGRAGQGKNGRENYRKRLRKNGIELGGRDGQAGQECVQVQDSGRRAGRLVEMPDGRKGISLQAMADPLDPRREDLPEDSALWQTVLEFTFKKKKQYGDLFYILHGFRGMGTRIKRTVKGNYVFRPEIDPAGKLAWEDEGEYVRAKKQWLAPREKVVLAALEELKMIKG